MFCTNCGHEVTGKFCAECGTSATGSPAVIASTPISTAPNTDPLFILKQCNYKKIDAIKAFREATGADLIEAKNAIDEAHNLYAKEIRLSEATKRIEGQAETRVARQEASQNASQHEKDRIAAAKASGQVYCPRCYSTSITGQKKGFGIGKAIVGAVLTGGIGLVAGNIGARNIRCTCMKCGHSWKT